MVDLALHHNSDSFKSKKGNCLSIRLAESAVFLPTDGAINRRGNSAPRGRNSLLRGLLVLDLVKPIKITSIDVELSAIASTAWPEGIGARRMIVTEEHRVFHASTTYFNACKTNSARRTASIGPGVSYHGRQDMDISAEVNVDEDFDGPSWDNLRAHFTGTHDHTLDATRSRSSDNAQPTHAGPVTGSSTYTDSQLLYPQDSSRSRGRPLATPDRLQARRVSADSFQRMPIYETNHEQDGLTPISPYSHLELEQMAPIPPYSFLPVSPTSAPSSPLSPTAAALSLEEFRNSLHSSIRNSQLYQSQTNLSISSSLSLHSILQQERSISRHPSLADVIPENLEMEGSIRGMSTPVRAASNGRSRSSTAHRESLSQSNARTQRHSPLPSSPPLSPSFPNSEVARQHSPTPLGSERGRNRSRFRFSAVSSILMDAVRTASPKKEEFRGSLERPLGLGSYRERSVDYGPRASSNDPRGRTMVRGVGGVLPGGEVGDGPQVDAGEREQSRTRGRESTSWVKRSTERGRSVLGRMLREKENEKEKEKEKGKGLKDKVEGWKEFKKGTYTYPISFSIPSNAPPSMHCDFGSVVWTLKASVHRPGAFKPKMTSSREVIAIACPIEEDTDDTENIIIERHWEQQLQYLISISGRSFYVGGTIPVTFTFMPLMKVRIHRLSVAVEERVDYYTNMSRIARTDPINLFTLLSIKGESKPSDPILPLDSDSPDAFRNSPLFVLVDPRSTDSELSETASMFMGPGPWTFHHDLRLPRSCDVLKFTNRNPASNITVTHQLKVVMRVERGDDEHVDGKMGKRRLFDIVVQTPILILSCRCNPEWTVLPRYAKVFDDSIAIVPTCPCQIAREQVATGARSSDYSGVFHSMSSVLARIPSHASDSSTASVAEGSPLVPSIMHSLHQRHYNEAMLHSSSLFERLISGQETERGEAPPAYDPSSALIPSSSRHPPVSVVPTINGVAVL